jgi:hypothetical protein
VPQLLRRFVALSAQDRAMFTRAFAYLAAVELTRRFGGLGRLVRQASFARGESLVRAGDPVYSARAVGYARWVERAARHTPFSAQCLHRSLALYLWLRRDGIDSLVRVGVRKMDDEFKAHAWVELEGLVVNDDARAVAAFSTLNRPPAFDAIAFVGDAEPGVV